MSDFSGNRADHLPDSLMDSSHYRIPADLVKTAAARLLPAPDGYHTPAGSLLDQLSNPEIAVIFQEMLESPLGESRSLKKHLRVLSEEEAQRDLLLRQIRLQTAKLTLREPKMELAGAAAGG